MSSLAAARELYPAIYEYLTSQGLDKTAKQFLKEASVPAPTPPDVKLMDMYNQVAGTKRKRDDAR